jgi:P27 family predicted phage terminase small subunit
MGKRGPAPKPTNLRLLHGDRQDRINTNEPQPAEGLPVCPTEVSPEVRAIWDYTLGQLATMKLASPADRDALLAYCEAVVTHRRACELLAKSSILIKGLHGGLVRNPAVQIQRDSALLLRALAQEFGLTPSARSQISFPGAVEVGGGRGASRLLSS